MLKRSFLIILGFLGLNAVYAQYPVIRIDSLQYVNPQRLATLQFNTPGRDNTFPDYISPTFKDPVYRDTVTIEGFVTFDPRSYGLSANRRSAWIQDSIGAPWAGVQLMFDSVASPASQAVTQFFQNMRKGRKIRATGVIRHFDGETQLTLINVPTEVLNINTTTIDPVVITPSKLQLNIDGQQTPQFETAEQWEGVYVELRNVYVVFNPGDQISAPTRFIWSVRDNNGNQVPIRDVSGYFRNDNNDGSLDPNTPPNPAFAPPANGSFLPFIKGIIVETGTGINKRYAIAPLVPSDVAQPSFQPPLIGLLSKNKSRITSSDDVTISGNITDGDGNVVSAVLNYAVGYNNTTFQTINMVKNSNNDVWTATIPAQADGSVVKYFVTATDNDANISVFPDSLALNSAYMVKNTISSISDIQETPYGSGASIFAGDTLTNISIKGVVVSTIRQRDLGYIILADGTGPNSAIFIRPTAGDGTANWRRGDSIEILSCIVRERGSQGADPFGRIASNGTTFLENVGFGNSNILATCANIPQGTILAFDSLVSPTFNKEPYEAVICQVNDVWVVAANADAPTSNFGEWAVNTDSSATTGLRGDDVSSHFGMNYNRDSLNIGGVKEFWPTYKGALVFTYGNWKFLPRNKTDISRAGDVIEPFITLNGNDTITLLQGDSYNELGANACDDVDGSFAADVDNSAVNTATPGTYIVTYSADDIAGNTASDVLRVVIVTPNNVSVNNNTLAGLKLYPNPSISSFNLSGDVKNADKVEIRLSDINGKVILTKSLNTVNNRFETEISTAALASGLYFCQIVANNEIQTIKVSVIK